MIDNQASLQKLDSWKFCGSLAVIVILHLSAGRVRFCEMNDDLFLT